MIALNGGALVTGLKKKVNAYMRGSTCSRTPRLFTILARRGAVGRGSGIGLLACCMRGRAMVSLLHCIACTQHTPTHSHTRTHISPLCGARHHTHTTLRHALYLSFFCRSPAHMHAPSIHLFLVNFNPSYLRQCQCDNDCTRVFPFLKK